MSDQSTSAPAQHDVQAINTVNDTGFNTALGLEFVELGPDLARARWTITPTQHQPYGIVHGGVYCAVIETVASVAGANWLGDKGNVVGVNNNTDFIRSMTEGRLDVVAEPVQQGRTQQLWQVLLTRADDGKLVARGQVRLQNVRRPGA